MRKEVIGNATLYLGDAFSVLSAMPDQSVNCCVTSPPYWGLRDYGVDGQLGLESTPAEYVEKMVAIFREVRRVLRDDGTLWLNLGDSYARAGGWADNAGLSGTARGESGRAITNQQEGVNGQKLAPGFKSKDLIGIPWRVAFALQADGWYLRQDIIWHKPNPMPESVTDRCTKAHEYIFLLSKSERYYFDADGIAEPCNRPEGPGNITHRHSQEGIYPNGAAQVNLSKIGPRETRNKRSVWTVTTQPYKEAHFATFPPKLIEPCILAGCPAGGIVLDTFNGSGTTGLVSLEHGRSYIGIELNPEYIELTIPRIENAQRQVRMFP